MTNLLKMKRISLILLALCCHLSLLTAAEVSVSGTVSFGEEAVPVPDYSVFLMVLGPNPSDYDALTDEEGFYEFSFDVDFAGSDELVLLVETFDLCTGEIFTQDLILVEGEELFSNVNFLLCADINPPPPPDGCEAFFGWEQTESEPFLVEFFDLSYNSTDQAADSWLWDFGDGTTSEEQNPLHEYAEEGDYEVTLTITFDTCISTMTQPVHVIDFDFCNCEWEYDPVCVVTPEGFIIPFINECEAICAGFEDAEFTECNGGEPCGCPEIYFPVCALTEDGDTLQFDNPCFAECEGYGEDSYVDCGGEGPCGCELDFEPVCVTNDEGFIEFFPNACVAECAGYGPDTYSNCDGLGCYAFFEYYVLDDIFTVEFVDLSQSTSSPPVSWEWNLGDGTTSSEPIVLHTYDEPGLYEVVLTITTEDGCTSSYTQTVCIGEDCVGNCDCPDIFDPVCVVDEAGVIITLPNACLAECLGYGPDTFVACEGDCVCPDVFDPVCVATDEGDIEWFVNACEAECEGYTPEDFTDCGEGCPCPEYLDPVCVIVEGGDTLQFDNPCFAECEGYGPDQYFHCDQYDPCGCYEIFAPVCVELEDGQVILFPNDCYALCEGFSEEDFVECGEGGFDGCYANFDFELYESGEVSFTDQSYTFEGIIESWLWDFGDGNTSEGQNPLHLYIEDGIYEVTLTIITVEGCTSTFTQHLCIGNGGIFDGPNCQAMFFFEQATDIPYTFQFTDFSFGNPDSWFWDFGDGNTSTEQNPVHTYEQEGVYLARLTITSGDCQSSMPMLLFTDQDIWYPNECMALFVPFVAPESSQVFFLNLSSPDAVSYEWDFGDGTTSNEPFATHVYESDGGTYEVSLTITTESGCTNTFSVNLNLGSGGFTGNPVYQLLNSTAIEADKELEVKAFPNPVKELLNVHIQSAPSGRYQLHLFGLDGRLYQSESRNLSSGDYTWQVETAGLAPGMYLLRLQSAEGIQAIKVVKD